MKLTLFSLFLFLSIFAFAQDQLGEPIHKEVEYYKKNMYKKTRPSKAVFKVIRTDYKENIRQEEKVRLEDDQTIYSRFYTNNKASGVWHEFTERDGVIEVDFNQTMYCEEVDQTPKSGEPVDSTDEHQGPIYNESETDFFEFILQSMRYPNYAKDKGVKGTVYLKFKVDTIGMVKDICIVQGAHWSLDAEAYRVIHLLKRFNQAATRNGKAEETTMNVPLRFNLR